MKPFKFFGRGSSQVRLKAFRLNILNDSNPLGRIPSYDIPFEPFDGMHEGDLRGPLRNLIEGIWTIQWCFSSMIIVRRDGYQTIITHDTVDYENSQGGIFGLDDYVMIRYNPR